MTCIFLAISAALGFLTDKVLQRCLTGYPWFPVALLLDTATCITLLLAFDNPSSVAKGLLFATTAILVSFYDGLTHEVPNLLLIPAVAIGLIEFNPVTALTGFVLSGLPFLIVALLTKGEIGGGDIKLMAAIGFSFGPSTTVCGALLGLMAFMPYGLIRRHRNHKSIPYALAPWLCSGCFFTYFLINSGGYK